MSATRTKTTTTTRRGAKFRNLYRMSLKGGGFSIWFIKQRDGRRLRRSTGTDDWDEAAAWRDLFEQRLKEEERRALHGLVPTFRELAKDFLEHGMSGLAETTRHDRERLLDADGSIIAHFGDAAVDEIRRGDVLRYWEQHVEGKGLSRKTGRNHLDAIAGVLGRADDLHELGGNPVDAARSALRRRSRGKLARAEAELATDTRRPLETVQEVEAFVAASHALYQEALEEQMAAQKEKRRAKHPDSIDGHLLDLLLLDAGLRLGEAIALQWGDLELPEHPDDTSRMLHVRRALSRGAYLGPPKSGRSRTVQMSRRLRAMLRRRHERAGRPAPDAWIFPPKSKRADRPGVDGSNYRSRHFARVCERAELGPRKPKDLRDTYASHLLSAGIQLAYISQQLGHANTDVTASAYARWCGGASYREALRLMPGEVPADLLARLAGSEAKRAGA